MQNNPVQNNSMPNNLVRTWVWLFCLAALTLAAYSFMLSGDFKTMDDDASIVRNDMIKDFGHLKPVFETSFFGGGSYYRPLVSLSFMLEYRVFGLNALYYYLDNVLLHILTALAVYGLMAFLLAGKIPGPRQGIFPAQSPAFFTALLFAIHPVQWEAVSNIPGRSILLCSLFFMLSFGFYCRSRDDEGNKGILLYGLSLSCFFLSLLSKECAIVMPFILLLYEFLFPKTDHRTSGKILPVIPFFFVLLIYFLIRMRYEVTHLFYWPNVPMAILGFLTFLESVLIHVRLLVFPVGLQFDRSLPLFMNFLNVRLIGVVLVFLVYLVLMLRFRRRMTPETRFFTGWFWIHLLPVSQLVVSVGVQPGYISTAEHFLYLPSVGFFALVVLFFLKIYRLGASRRVLSTAGFGLIVTAVFVFLWCMTVQQNIYSSNEIAMFERALELSPRNIRIRTSLARLYAKYNQFDLAEGHFRQALGFDPGNVRARIGLGKVLCDQGKLWEGIREYDKIRDAGGLKDLLRENLQATYNVLQFRYQKQIPQEPENPKLHYALGMVYSRMGRIEEASEEYTRGIHMEGDFKKALFNIASTHLDLGDLPQAARYYNVMLSIIGGTNQWDAPARQKLKEIYEKMGDNQKAGQYNN